MTTASDNFTRTDETPLASPWATSMSDGGLNLNSGTVSGTAGTTRGSYYTGTWSADQWSQATISNMIGSVNTRPGVLVRAGASGNAFGVLVSGGAGDNDIIRYDASVPTVLGTTVQFANNDVLRLEVSGTSPNIQLRVYKNGALQTTLAGVSGHNSGNPGLVARGGGVVDTWSAEDVAAPAVLEAYGGGGWKRDQPSRQKEDYSSHVPGRSSWMG